MGNCGRIPFFLGALNSQYNATALVNRAAIVPSLLKFSACRPMFAEILLLTRLRSCSVGGSKSAACASSKLSRSASRGIAARFMQNARAALSIRSTCRNCEETAMMSTATIGAYSSISFFAVQSTPPPLVKPARQPLAKPVQPNAALFQHDNDKQAQPHPQRVVEDDAEVEHGARRPRTISRWCAETDPCVDEKQQGRNDPFAVMNHLQ